MKNYESHYKELFPALEGLNPTTIVEVGMNEGFGTIRLKERYPNSRIFTIDEHVRAPDYTDEREPSIQRLQGVATIIIEKSPFPFPWPFEYDLCTIDIGSDPEINYEQLKYWEKWGKKNSILALGVPNSDERRRLRKKNLIEKLKNENYVYQEIFNWFVFKTLWQNK